MKDGYWVRYAGSGELRSLYRIVDGDLFGFDWRVGDFTPYEGDRPGFGWDTDFDPISDEEGDRLYQSLRSKVKAQMVSNMCLDFSVGV